ncbi:uncharacterized protein ELE39_000797 [Cryptosporidium sp. chipmunk genotype I]|uniref:uncharacterized protein n=1 Tax=Cryptosporidium sp. chipmunk genotype I TaxID=1280935 RepID=UPI00351A7457|nr:hypothetical protein ELE39_000797 [Cryptosporidium sp. chipmunk genotype I]
MAHQILGFICDESLYCNIILLDRPRPPFKLDKEVNSSNSKSKKDQKNEKVQEDKKKKKKIKKKKKNNCTDDKGTENYDSEDENDEDDDINEDSNDENGNEDDNEDDQGDNNGSRIKVRNNRKKKKNEGPVSSYSGSGSNSNSDTNSESKSNSGSDLDSDSDSDFSNENLEDNEYGNDDDDYYEENDYLAFKRETYRGVFESKLMDGLVKISYNTKNDEIKETRKKRKMLKNSANNNNGNSEENFIDYKLSYHKSIEFEFDRFFFTIEHKYNQSIVKMIIFETENRSYEIRFRVDPELGRDNFYYAMIAFQGCYRSQNYGWDDHLKNGNIAPIKDLIQEELELLALKGYN